MYHSHIYPFYVLCRFLILLYSMLPDSDSRKDIIISRSMFFAKANHGWYPTMKKEDYLPLRGRSASPSATSILKLFFDLSIKLSRHVDSVNSRQIIVNAKPLCYPTLPWVHHRRLSLVEWSCADIALIRVINHFKKGTIYWSEKGGKGVNIECTSEEEVFWNTYTLPAEPLE